MNRTLRSTVWTGLPYGRDESGRSVLDCLRLIADGCGGFDGLHGLRLIIDDLAGGELGFELVNDLRVHLLVDLDLEQAQGPEGGMPTGNRRLAPQMTNPMEICLADEVRKALRAECCGAALVLALTISDAYGKIAFPEEKVGKRYKEWYRRYCGYGFGSR